MGIDNTLYLFLSVSICCALGLKFLSYIALICIYILLIVCWVDYTMALTRIRFATCTVLLLLYPS